MIFLGSKSWLSKIPSLVFSVVKLFNLSRYCVYLSTWFIQWLQRRLIAWKRFIIIWIGIRDKFMLHLQQIYVHLCYWHLKMTHLWGLSRTHPLELFNKSKDNEINSTWKSQLQQRRSANYQNQTLNLILTNILHNSNSNKTKQRKKQKHQITMKQFLGTQKEIEIHWAMSWPPNKNSG